MGIDNEVLISVTLVSLTTFQHRAPTSPLSVNLHVQRSFVLLINIKLFFASIVVKPWSCSSSLTFLRSPSESLSGQSRLTKVQDEILFGVGVCHGYSISLLFLSLFFVILVMTFPSLLRLFSHLCSLMSHRLICLTTHQMFHLYDSHRC